MKCTFTKNDKGKPPAYAPILGTYKKKLADCELRFDEGPLTGLKLQGFVIWERIKEDPQFPDAAVGSLSITPPGYSDPRPNISAGFQATISLLRPIDDDTFSYTGVGGTLKSVILEAFRKWAPQDERRKQDEE